MYDSAANTTSNKVKTSIVFMGITLLRKTRGHLTSENHIQLSFQLYNQIIAQIEQMFNLYAIFSNASLDKIFLILAKNKMDATITETMSDTGSAK